MLGCIGQITHHMQRSVFRQQARAKRCQGSAVKARGIDFVKIQVRPFDRII
jgi:hypothetical protein